MDDLGEILRREREWRLLPQGMVARRCGMPQQQLSRYETGAAAPSWRTFARVLAVFDVQLRVVLDSPASTSP